MTMVVENDMVLISIQGEKPEAPEEPQPGMGVGRQRSQMLLLDGGVSRASDLGAKK